jgi:hypothetical protein
MWSLQHISDARIATASNPAKYAQMLLFLLCCFLPGLSLGQTGDVVCSEGYGKFEEKFTTGVSVLVRPVKNGALSTRVCEARLSWDKQDLLVVSKASQVDIDVLGADLGFGTPVVAFQMKTTGVQSTMTYEIYSLQKPPRLLRTITGGDFFSASDTDLAGSVEIWTGDAGAIDNFEGLALGEFDFAPTIVLRFERGQLTDVSSQFQSNFDQQIAKIRAQLDSQELSNFKDSNGALLIKSLPLERRHALRITKIKVLEIVWCYLYSGREGEAWHALSEMWPPADFDRIRASILTVRAHGIHAQVDGISPKQSRFHSKKHAHIFETVKDADQNLGILALVDAHPKPILLRRPPPLSILLAVPKSEVLLDLVIDEAGKVRSADPVGELDEDLISAAPKWKFIPAFKDGRAVACRLRMAFLASQ